MVGADGFMGNAEGETVFHLDNAETALAGFNQRGDFILFCFNDYQPAVRKLFLEGLSY